MALILDGNIEIGAHVWRDLGYLICSKHLVKLKIGFSFLEKYLFYFIRALRVLSDHLI